MSRTDVPAKGVCVERRVVEVEPVVVVDGVLVEGADDVVLDDENENGVVVGTGVGGASVGQGQC